MSRTDSAFRSAFSFRVRGMWRTADDRKSADRRRSASGRFYRIARHTAHEYPPVWWRFAVELVEASVDIEVLGADQAVGEHQAQRRLVHRIVRPDHAHGIRWDRARGCSGVRSPAPPRATSPGRRGACLHAGQPHDLRGGRGVAPGTYAKQRSSSIESSGHLRMAVVHPAAASSSISVRQRIGVLPCGLWKETRIHPGSAMRPAHRSSTGQSHPW